LLSKQYKLFVCSRAAESLQLYVNKRAAKCTLPIVLHLLLCFVHYFNSKFETLFYSWGWIVLNFVLKFWAKM